MRIIDKFALCTLAILISAPVAGSAFAQAAQGDSSAKDSGRLICRSQGSTGSRLRSNRICLTAIQWRAREEQAHRSIQEAGRDLADNRACGISGCPPGT